MMKGRDEEYDYLYKIVLVGDAGVGKTHILSRYIKGSLPKNPTATIGVEFATRTVPLQSGGTVKAQIWDTAGQERYRAITSAHYRRAVGAMLVYDVTSEKTFANAKRWMEELRDHAEPDIVIMLVGNKIDLCDRNPAARKVPIEQASEFAKANRLLFEETSSITAARVKESFETLLQAIYNEKSSATNKAKKENPNARLAAKPPSEPNSRSCCG
jgi:small GTP-binding protein